MPSNLHKNLTKKSQFIIFVPAWEGWAIFKQSIGKNFRCMKQEKPRLELTGDGSHTLYLQGLDEYYHSWHGAIQESRHVFIDQGLKQVKGEQVRLLEVGFGTGLNAWLTCMEAESMGLKVDYHTIELYPLSGEIIHKLNYTRQLGNQGAAIFEDIYRAGWDQQSVINPFFSIHKILADFLNFHPKGTYRLIYFDAFAPDKQPAMWQEEQLIKMYNALEPGGIMVTYCAKGKIKRLLRGIGFCVESLPGPPGKREMIRAIRSE